MKEKIRLSVASFIALLAFGSIANADPIACNAGRVFCNDQYRQCLADGRSVPVCTQLRDECVRDFCQ